MEIRALTPVAPRPGMVSRILPFSCVDGPGSRLVVFFQGCNMDCPGCHNPQTIGQCNHCGDCIEHCPNGALSLERGSGQRKRKLCDESQCQSCDLCLPHCPRSGNPNAVSFDVASLVERIARHAPLLDGVTFSGGEATLQRQFLVRLCDALDQDRRTAHLGRLIDSNGLLAAGHWPALLERVDGMMLDIKGMDSAIHKRLTGRDNQQVLASAKLLAQANKLAELRWLVVEGVNDGDDELTALIELYHSLPSPPALRLNRYQHHGVGERGQSLAETTSERVEALYGQLSEAGVTLLPLVRL
ncbi:YjjW family glycine radical enzyme activase [Ferrimonas sp. YFM]|uniref:YjjW family glycine radical enzyme activase n=1 Tax=Ferrimonas sp. YFM TaxID=3028878 RepID=UPI002572A7E7|nr:YjjW family glycine radical enzyme activase [Ferrimonas sp. YFM]